MSDFITEDDEELIKASGWQDINEEEENIEEKRMVSGQIFNIIMIILLINSLIFSSLHLRKLEKDEKNNT